MRLALAPAFGGVSISDLGHSNSCIVISNCCFNLNFPHNIRCGALFHMYIYHKYIFFIEVSVEVGGLFLNGVVCFLIAECHMLFKIKWIITINNYQGKQ